MSNPSRLHIIKACVLSAAMLASMSQAGQGDIDKIEAAAARMNASQLMQLSQTLTGYDLALAQYRLAITANMAQQQQQAEQALERSLDTLKQLQQAQTDNVEVMALLAQVYGYKIAMSPIKGIYYGPKAQAMLSKAEAIAPNNPRVQLVKGISAVNTPPLFGGSHSAAMDAFNLAISSFEADYYSDFHWGHAEAYTWRGLLKQRLGGLEQAKADWQKALEISPDYGWARYLLSQS